MIEEELIKKLIEVIALEFNKKPEEVKEIFLKLYSDEIYLN